MFQISRHCLPFAHQPLVSHMTLQLNIIFLFSKLKSCNQPVFAIKMELFSSPIFSPLCPHLSPLCSPHRPCTLLQVTSHFCNLVLSCLLKTKQFRMKSLTTSWVSFPKSYLYSVLYIYEFFLFQYGLSALQQRWDGESSH